MGVEIRNIGDPVLETELVDALRSSGFDPVQRSDVIVLRGVGHHEGDRSVDMEIDLIEMDSFRVLQFRSLLRTEPAGFQQASLAAIRGNGACAIPKFDVVELDRDLPREHRFGIRASFHLYADHLSRQELRVMLMLFLKEVDAIDNELAEMVSPN
jgi:hypothetical protein